MSTMTINEEQLENAVKDLFQDLQGIFKNEEMKEKKEMKDQDEMEEKKEKMAMMPEKTEKAEELEVAVPPELMEEEEVEEYTLEELEADYAKLPLEDLKMHYLAAKKAMAMAMEEEGHEEPDGDEMMPMKQEKKMGMGMNMGKSMKKAEPSISFAKFQKMENKLSLMQKAIEKIAALPLSRKAITDTSSIKKSEGSKSFTYQEMTQKLREVAATPLSKNDRELINGYYLGTVDPIKLSHLLDK